MKKEIFNLFKGPEYPISQAVRVGDYVFLSGLGGFQDTKTGEEIKGVENQTKRCLENIKLLLEASGSSLRNVVKVTIFLRNLEDFTKVNDIYKGYFPHEPPARSTIIADLVIPTMLIEMECIAYWEPLY